MFTHEEFMAWVTNAISSYNEMGDDPRFDVSTELEGEAITCEVKYWSPDEMDSPDPTDNATIVLIVK